MKLDPSLEAWLAVVVMRRRVPVDPADGSGRDSHLHPKVARRLEGFGFIARSRCGEFWEPTIAGVVRSNARKA